MQSKICAGCKQASVAVRVLMYGQPYNSTTLEGCQPDPNAVNEKVLINKLFLYSFLFIAEISGFFDV